MGRFENLKEMRVKKLKVSSLLESPVKLERLTKPGIGDENPILDKNLYRPQLALAGYLGIFNYKQVQIFGNTEYIFLHGLTKPKREEAFRTLVQFPIPCVVVTNDLVLDKELIDIANENEVPVFKTPYDTTMAQSLLSEYLDDQFAPQVVVHGSFVDVYGVGVLFVGRSGIGKSEIALDLVERGHRLVADDAVMLTKKREAVLMGTATTLAKHFMEIRGLGIIDVRQMFGIRSIRFQKRLEIIVELLEWNPNEEYTRIGSLLDEDPSTIMGVEIPTVKLPIFPGKNITVIAEVIAINYLLRTYGYDAAQVFSEALKAKINKNKSPGSAFEDQRLVRYFQSDNE